MSNCACPSIILHLFFLSLCVHVCGGFVCGASVIWGVHVCARIQCGWRTEFCAVAWRGMLCTIVCVCVCVCVCTYTIVVEVGGASLAEVPQRRCGVHVCVYAELLPGSARGNKERRVGVTTSGRPSTSTFAREKWLSPLSTARSLLYAKMSIVLTGYVLPYHVLLQL